MNVPSSRRTGTRLSLHEPVHGQSRSRVLVVEPDGDTRLILAQALHDFGFVVSVAGEGHDGLVRLREEKPGIVLLNRIMPDMDGIEFLKRLRAHPDPSIARARVVVMTGMTSTVATEHGLELSVCIARPFRMEELLRALEPLPEP